MNVDLLTNPAVIGIAASILFGLIKRTGSLDLARDEARFVMAVLLAGVAGAVLVQEPSGAWSYVVAFGQAAAASVLAYNGWKNIVRRWLKRVLGWNVDVDELMVAETKARRVRGD